MKKFKGYVSFDFDGVIASYIRPFVVDKFGKPQQEIIKTMQYLSKKGYYVLIFTGRLESAKFVKWLKKNKVPYDGINVQPLSMTQVNNGKPFFNVVVDDKAVSYHWKHNKKSKIELISEIEEKLIWSKE